jgi:hypothetical protein
MELVRSGAFRTEATEGGTEDAEALWGRTVERVILIARLT